MKIQSSLYNKILYMQLRGELDEHNAPIARREADKTIETYALQCQYAVFDLQEISFMDSTGIGFLIGRYKKLQRHGVPAYIANPSLSTDRILTMSGVYSLLPKLGDGAQDRKV